MGSGMTDTGWREDGAQPAPEKTREETDRKCPQCGGVMDFDPATGGLHCPYCDYTERIPTAKDAGDGNGEAQTAQELDFAGALHAENCDWGVKKKIIVCRACGGQSIYDARELANECPYCGSNQVMEEESEQTMAPGGVVPFAVTAKEAAAGFVSWIRRKLFCPRAAKEGAKPKAFKGVYLPYWTFDAHTVSDYAAEYGIDRRVRTKEGERVVTDWHSTGGRYREDIDDELVLASDRYDTELMKHVEPFGTADNRAYRPEYVAGFAAERYSVGLKEGWERAKKRIAGKLRADIEDRVRQEHGADHVRIRRVDTAYSAVTYKYLLLPVWLSAYRYRDKVYHFMVNGQTGKAGGQTPVSWMRVAIAVLLVAAVFLLCSDLAAWGAAAAVLAAILALACRILRM